MLRKRLVTKLWFQPQCKLACAAKGSCKIPQARVSTPGRSSPTPTTVTGACSVVMIRHGQSEWGKLNLFCGWYNSALSERGIKEAVNAGKTLKDAGYKFDVAYTSSLTRANITLDIMLKELGQENIPKIKTWRLNERHYGALTGMNRIDAVEKYGKKQVSIWRRSYDILPPPITPEHPHYRAIIDDPIFRDGPPKKEFPLVESLKQTIARALPFWLEKIAPELKKGKTILIAAHGTSLRGIVKHLDQISNEAITKLNLPTGIPFKYTLDKNLKPVPKGSLQFFGDPEKVKKAIEEVANQIKKKK